MTGRLKPADNFLAVEVNNTRTPDAIPAMAFDWWNYGGITRDVSLVSVPEAFVEDYFIRLDKGFRRPDQRRCPVVGAPAGTSVLVEIPGTESPGDGFRRRTGCGGAFVPVKNLKRWSPEDPKLYRVIVSAGRDRVEEMIGFRNAGRGRGHLSQRRARVPQIGQLPRGDTAAHGPRVLRVGRRDAVVRGPALGCNMIRLAHYPQNEYIVRLAEKMGFMLWEEIPVWQGIDFANDATRQKAAHDPRNGRTRQKPLRVDFLGVANETQPSESRNEFLPLPDLLPGVGRHAADRRGFRSGAVRPRPSLFVMDDPFIEALDVGGQQIHGLVPSVARHARSGCGTLRGETAHHLRIRRRGPLRTARRGRYGQFVERRVSGGPLPGQPPHVRVHSQPAGVSPWILFDFRSPFRFHPTNQEGWNRKGLVSDRGYRKKAWYLMKAYYDKR